MKVDGRNDLAPSLRPESPYAKGALSLRFFAHAASLDRIGVSVLRVGLVIVLVWIGALKFADYEADSIVPLVANSPLMSFVYHHPAPEYRAHMNREGELFPAHRAWQIDNGTYTFSHFLGRRNRYARFSDCHSQIHTAGCSSRQRLSCSHGLHNALLPGDHTRSLGPGRRSRSPRIPLPLGSRTPHCERRNHVWGCNHNHG